MKYTRQRCSEIYTETSIYILSTLLFIFIYLYTWKPQILPFVYVSSLWNYYTVVITFYVFMQFKGKLSKIKSKQN